MKNTFGVLGLLLLLEPLGPAHPTPWLSLRCWVQRRFEALPLAPGLGRDLWGALSLGLPPAREDTFSPFAESGTIHTLVVSGLQVTLVMGGLEALGRRLGQGRGWRALGAAAGGGLLYCGLVGFSAPVWRGLLMGLAWAAGKGSGWKLPPVLSLHGALLLWLFTHPAAGAEPGFLLAWLALVGLAWGAEPLAGLLSPLLRNLAMPLAQVLAPWLSTLPLLALLHGGVPLWGVPANLVLLPMVAFLAPVCLLLVLVPVPWAVAALGAVLAWTGGTLVPWFARMVPLATGCLWPWVGLILGWLLLAHLQSRFRRTRGLCVGLLGVSLVLMARRGTGHAPETLTVEGLDIGQGDALLLRVPSGEATLVDTGPDARGARRIVRTLSRRGVREPVHLILTHPHLDHAGGWATLGRLWPLASVSMPPLAGPTSPWAAYAPPGGLASAIPLLRGGAWTRGEAAFTVRWPPSPLRVKDLNMSSAVLRVRWRDRELWFMGDALALQEEDLLALGEPGPPWGSRLLKAGHHGSRSASTPAWVAALDPEVALVCAGRENAFDHPHPEALAALTAQGAEAFITGPAGGVLLEARPGGWRVEEGLGRVTFRALRLPEEASALQGFHEGQAQPGVVGPPLRVGLGAHPVRHGQGRGAGDPCRLAGGEDARQFQVLGRRMLGQQVGACPGPGDPGRDRHRVGWERHRIRGRPPGDLQLGPVGPALEHVQGQGLRLGCADEVPDLEPVVIGATGADEQDPPGRKGREQPRRGHRRREGAHTRTRHPPPLRRTSLQARQFGGEGGEEEGGAWGHQSHSSQSAARCEKKRGGRKAPALRNSAAYFCSRTACAAARIATGTR